MPSRYATELERLREVYELAISADPPSDFLDLMSQLAGRQVYFVGSGGALAIAQVAAELHMHATGQGAFALPPMLFAQSPRLNDAAVVLFSSGARNPDAAVALAAAREREHYPVGLVTSRGFSDLPARITRHRPIVATVPSPKNGFLATGSVLATAVLLFRSAGIQLPESATFRWNSNPDLGHRDHLTVLYGGGLRPVATDIETRISELGLRSVQAVDYRSFAHGRHVGYAIRSADTTILALIDPASREVATRTLATLPPTAHIVKAQSQLTWPGSLIDLLLWAMATPLSLAESSLDPGKPKVQAFGRKLYHLPIQQAMEGVHLGPVTRKSSAGHLFRSEQTLRSKFVQWLTWAQDQHIGGLVLDYDGTVCETDKRYDPPDLATQRAIVTLARRGISLGFASGRGKSLSNALQAWLPEEHWKSTVLGLYNGSVVVSLADKVGDYSRVSEDGRELTRALREVLGSSVTLNPRSTQISISPSTTIAVTVLLGEIATVLERFDGRWQAVTSGHSVDVVPRDASKRAVLTRLQDRCNDLEVIAIGDQGQWGGNDFALLAATPLSLSVDRISSDPSRCWNLATRGERGPRLLRQYLRAIKPGRLSTARFIWPESL